MKTLLLTILMTAMALGAQAQQMERAIYDFAQKYGEDYVKNINKTTWLLADGKTEGYRVTYYFEMPHSKEVTLDRIKKAYAEDKKKAYTIYERQPNGPADFGSLYITFGKDNKQFGFHFGWWKNRSFRIVCIRDEKNPDHRLFTDLEWYDEDGILKGELWVIYGDDPQRVIPETTSSAPSNRGENRATGSNVVTFSPDSIRSEQDCMTYLYGLYGLYMNPVPSKEESEGEYMKLYQMNLLYRLAKFCPTAQKYLTKKSKEEWLEKIDDMMTRTDDELIKRFLQSLKQNY